VTAHTREKSPSLLALTSSALMLPAYQAAIADAPPDFTEVGVRYSNYEEDDTQAGKTFGGSSERYEIDVAQFHLLAPVADNWSVAFDVQREDMSGASPWFIGTNLDGKPEIIMSGASIDDTRTDISVTTRYYYEHGNIGANYAYSDEDDYESHAFALDASRNSADGLTTYTVAVSGSNDDITPTQGAVPTNTLDDNKDIRSGFLGISRIISKRAIVRLGLSYTYRDGFLTDPYKLNDRRPDERKEWAFSGGYRQFFVSPNAALHADYRYFDDDWGLQSHTLELGWHQNLGSKTQLIPYLRYYTQSEAKFFSNQIDFTDQYFADDYRLSAFGAFTTGLRLRTKVNNWTLTVAGERYTTSESWGMYNGEESPALVKFNRFTVGLDYQFR
jgi:hypothetical protein